MIGRVVSVKSQKTATILVERAKKHPLYQKSVVRTKKYLVHDLLGVSLGDVVEVVKVRPISKNKHWQIVKKVGQDMVALGTQHMKDVATETIEEVQPSEKEEQSEIITSEVTEEIKAEAAPKKVAKKKGAK